MTKKRVTTEGHLTSIITSKPELIKKDPLSMEVFQVRDVISKLPIGETEKLGLLLQKFENLIMQNCMRIKHMYEKFDCPDVVVEPAIGYFVPNIHIQNPLLHGAEPSSIITASDLTYDGLQKFLFASGKIGQDYPQIAEILKFSITPEKFFEYFRHTLCKDKSLIGAVTDANFILTFEAVISIAELLGESISQILSEKYFENYELYANIIMKLAKEFYGASTWPIRGEKFSTIYIRGWDGAGRQFEEWFNGLRVFLKRFPEEIITSMGQNHGMGKETSFQKKGRHRKIKMVGELLLIPQSKLGELTGDNLTYDELLSDKKRELIVKKLLQIL